MAVNLFVGCGDRLYASDNEYGIPSLIMEGQPESSILYPVCLWGHKGKYRNLVKTYLFYLPDKSIKGLSKNPLKVILSGCEEVAELNFTVNDNTPPAIAIEATYQKRWISRNLQERGFKVWVDLNVSRRYADLNLMGVPKGYNGFITRGYEDRIQDIAFELSLAKQVSGLDHPNMAVYGGGKKVQDFCEKHLLHHIWDLSHENKNGLEKGGGHE